MIVYLGLFCLLLKLTGASDAEIFSIFNDKDSNSLNSHNTKKVKTFPHDSFEFPFPFFNDLFPLSGLDSKPKERHSISNLKDDKDIFIDIDIDNPEETQTFDDKGKKKNGKDKLVMSFTELFIPFQKHKNQYDNSVKRSNIFDDVFFPFIDFDGGFFDKQTNKKHKIPKKKFDKNIKLLNSTTKDKLFEKNYKDATPKHSKSNRFEPKFVKSENLITFSKVNNSVEKCCDKHNECNTGAHCSSNKCISNTINNESTEIGSLKKSFLLDKTFLMCVIPGLLGFGALIFGIEVLRRHNELVKKTPFFSQYNHVQTC